MPHILPEDTESRLIKQNILLPFVIATLERDKLAVTTKIGVKIPEAYALVFDSVLQRVYLDSHLYRKELRQSRIKIWEKSRNDTSIIYRYSYKGYTHQIELLWSRVRTEVQLLLVMYFTKETPAGAATLLGLTAAASKTKPAH